MILVYLALAAALIGVVMMILSQQHVAISRHHRKYYLLGGGLLLIICSLFVALLGLNIQNYTPFDEDPIIATVSVRALYPVAKTYSVTITRHGSSERTTTCILQGDEMGLSGRAQYWRNWTSLVGHQSTYALDRAVSRYFHFMPPRLGAEPITSCTISPRKPKIAYFLPGTLIRWVTDLVIAHQRPLRPLSFVPLIDGAVYDMEITPQGIIPHPRVIRMQAV